MPSNGVSCHFCSMSFRTCFERDPILKFPENHFHRIPSNSKMWAPPRTPSIPNPNLPTLPRSHENNQELHQRMERSHPQAVMFFKYFSIGGGGGGEGVRSKKRKFSFRPRFVSHFLKHLWGFGGRGWAILIFRRRRLNKNINARKQWWAWLCKRSATWCPITQITLQMDKDSKPCADCHQTFRGGSPVYTYLPAGKIILWKSVNPFQNDTETLNIILRATPPLKNTFSQHFRNF